MPGWQLRSPMRVCYFTSVVSNSETPRTVAHQAPLSMGFSRQEYTGVGHHVLLQGIFPPRDWTQVSYVFCISRWVLCHYCCLGRSHKPQGWLHPPAPTAEPEPSEACAPQILSVQWKILCDTRETLPGSTKTWQRQINCLVAKSRPALLQPHGLQPTRLLCPWDFPGRNTGVGCHCLLQGTFPTQGWNPGLLHWQADSLPLSRQGSSAKWVNKDLNLTKKIYA